MQAHRNLLFGILAVQLNFISRGDLVSGMSTWVQQRDKALGEILVGQGKLTADQLFALNGMLAQYLKAHGDDVERGIKALPGAATVASWLTPIADPDVKSSIDVIFAGVDTVAQEPRREGARYQKLRIHDDGGQGQIWLAEDTALGRQVAIKELKPKFMDDRDTRNRFLHEAQVTGSLQHPGVVPIHDLGQDALGRPYYVMRFLEGGPLADQIRAFHDADARPRRDPLERRLAFRQLLRRFIDVCNAVAYAHSKGVLHRDLKPRNVMLGKFGETLVIDWGMAKTGVAGTQAGAPGSPADEPPVSASALDLAATRFGMIKGTIPYMSPEQALGRIDLGPASDVYSLGSMLYEILAGTRAYTGATGDAKERHQEILTKVQKGEFTPPAVVRASVPPALDAICCKAMAFRMSDRYPSALALAGEVENWLADEPVSAYQEPWSARMGRWARRHQKAVVGVLAASIVAMLALALSTVVVSAEQRETDRQRAKAVKNFAMARRQAFDIIRLIETTEPELAFVPALHDRRKELLTTASEACRQFLEQDQTDVEIQKQAAQIFRYSANFRRFTNETKEAAPLYQDAIAQLEKLAANQPQEAAEDRLRLADTLRDYASLDIKLGNLTAAADKLNRSQKIVAELRKADPRFAPYRRSAALACLNLANIEYRQAKPDGFDKPKQTLAGGVALLQELNDAGPDTRHAYDSLLMAAALNIRAVVERSSGELAEAETTHKAAVALLRGMLDQKSKSVNEADVVHFLSECQVEQAKTWAQIGKANYVASAQKNISLAINKLGELERNYRKAPVYKEAAGSAFVARGEIRESAKDFVKAAEDFTSARGLLGPLAEEYPDLPELHADLGKAYAGLGRIAHSHGNAKDAASHFQSAASELNKASEQSPTDQRIVRELAALAKPVP